MKRRDFLTQSLPAAGAVLIAPGFLNFQVLSEINHQFEGNSDVENYDLVINGAGLAGYFSAIYAAQKGLKVLIVEKRPSPGFDITAKMNLWLNEDGLDRFDNDLTSLFFPEQEILEINNSTGKGPYKSLFGDELSLFSGSLRKGLLRNLLVNKVHVLLMTDVCGIFSDGTKLSGLLLACKHGIYSVKCNNFIDASDNLLFSRQIAGQDYAFKKAGFILEIRDAINPVKKSVKIPEQIGVLNNEIFLHPAKNIDHQTFVEFEFPAEGNDTGQIEVSARTIAAKIGSILPGIDPSFSKAKINQLAFETNLFLQNEELPKPVLNGHILFPNPPKSYSCLDIQEIRSEAKKQLDSLKAGEKAASPKELIIPGAKIPVNKLVFTHPDEPGLSVPLKRCSFNFAEYLPGDMHCQVLVAGGGTAGSMAGIGACEKGASTIVIDYFNDLGGTKTMGGVMGYYHGVKDNAYLKKQEAEASRLAGELNMTNKIGRTSYLLKSLLFLGGTYVPGSIICNALVNNSKVEGVIICRNGKLAIIKGAVTIDSTGDGDVAFFAGAKYHHGNTRSGITQNYSQWDIAGGGKLPSATGRDYDIIDNTKISELQRGLFLSHYEAHFYDFHPFLTVRESRRVEGLYTLDLIDAVEGTHFEDMISIASSDYDPHYTGISEYTRCGFLLPHSNVLTVEIPYRSIVPKDLDGLLISGRAFSQTHNALQFTRMSADLIVLGYLTGQIAAFVSIENTQPRSFNISGLQKEWQDLDYITQDYSKRRVGNAVGNPDEIRERVKNLAEGKREFLYACSLLPKAQALPVLRSVSVGSLKPDGRLLVTKALAWFGEPSGVEEIEEELIALFEEEMKTGYPGGYVENYDFIRGREKNVLEGLFWRINQNIALLAMSGSQKGNPAIRRILDSTTSGGKMVSRENDYYNGRIDLRIIPFYNRIMNLCFYAERLPDPVFIPGFEKLLQDENIAGYKTVDYDKTRWRVYGGDLEMQIGAALARCGSLVGYQILVDYIGDVHYNFKSFAVSELQSLTNQNFGYDAKKWMNYCNGLKSLQPLKKLEFITEK